MRKELRQSGTTASLYVDPANKRLRIDDVEGDVTVLLDWLHQEGADWVQKIIIKARPDSRILLRNRGYREEAVIPGYFSGITMHFMVRYTDPLRALSRQVLLEDNILHQLQSTPVATENAVTDHVSWAQEGDANELTQLYRKTFNFYPTPIGEDGHVLKTMTEGTVYAVIRHGGRIVSAASAEVVPSYANAELTDCASLPEARGRGHMKSLLTFLEEQLRGSGIRCFYTIARAESLAMNKAFYQLGYAYGGRLVNNCYISTGIEDMNVWHKYRE